MATQGGYYQQYYPGAQSTPVDHPPAPNPGELDEDGHPARYCNIAREDGSICGALCKSNTVSKGEKTRGKILYLCQEKEPNAPIVNGYPQSHGYNGFVGDEGPPKRFGGGGGASRAPAGSSQQQRQEQVGQVQAFSLVQLKEQGTDLFREVLELKGTVASMADQIGMLLAMKRQAQGNRSQVQQAQQQSSLPVARSDPSGPVAYPGAAASTGLQQRGY